MDLQYRYIKIFMDPEIGYRYRFRMHYRTTYFFYIWYVSMWYLPVRGEQKILRLYFFIRYKLLHIDI